jgi:hypothetical protein
MATRDAKAAQSTDFVVRLEGITVPERAAEQIAAGIRAVLMKELAGVDFGGDVATRIPFRGSWLGMWLRRGELTHRVDLQLNEIQR